MSVNHTEMSYRIMGLGRRTPRQRHLGPDQRVHRAPSASLLVKPLPHVGLPVGVGSPTTVDITSVSPDVHNTSEVTFDYSEHFCYFSAHTIFISMLQGNKIIRWEFEVDCSLYCTISKQQ